MSKRTKKNISYRQANSNMSIHSTKELLERDVVDRNNRDVENAKKKGMVKVNKYMKKNS